MDLEIDGMIENIGGGYLILDPHTRDTRTDDDDVIFLLHRETLISQSLKKIRDSVTVHSPCKTTKIFNAMD